MTDSPTDGPDTALAASEGLSKTERQDVPGQDTPAAPQQVIEQFEQFISGGIGHVRNPVLDKINEEHIATALELAGKNDARTFEYSKAERRYRLTYVLIALAAFFALTFYLLPVDKELYKQVVQVLVAFGGGFGVGYGVRHWQS